jgi:hypothetical protein
MDAPRSGWAGWSAFAAIVLMLSGPMHALTGISAIAHDEIVVYAPGHVITLDATVWGWIFLVVGTIQFFAGLFVLTGAVWARAVAVIVVVGSLVTNFATLPYQPGWSIALIAVGVLTIYALTVHGRDIAD